MSKLRMLSLCSGIGGADLAAEWTGAIEIAGQVEIDAFCVHVLEQHWPHVKRRGDIREVQGDEFGDIDIVVAGFPCQPHSLAGKRTGGQDERNLWPEVKRLLGATSGRWFVGENVSGLLSSEAGRFFGGILADLDALGYRVGWAVYGASEVGAPHRRERVFLVAYLPRIRSDARRPQSERQQWTPNADSTSTMAYTTSARCQEQQDPAGLHNRPQPSSTSPLAHPHSRKCITRAQLTRQCGEISLDGSSTSGMAHANGSGCQECDMSPIAERTRYAPWRKSAPGAADTGTLESRVGRMLDGFSNWLDRSLWPAGPGQQQYDWEPPRTTTDRQKNRIARLKALGNAIVPQHIYPIFQAIVEWENQRK